MINYKVNLCKTDYHRKIEYIYCNIFINIVGFKKNNNLKEE